MKLRRLTFAALLTTIALILFTVEAQLPPLTAIPGIKIGLSNVVTVFALYTLGAVPALAVLLVRVVLGGLITGQVSAILYSLSGGLLAWTLSALLKRFFQDDKLWVLSVFAAAVHNVGQLGCAVLITMTPSLFWYLPLLLIAGILAGAFTGLAAQQVLKRLGAKLRF